MLPFFINNKLYAQCNKLDISETVSYKKIYDGDSLLLDDGRKIRLIGIDAPEIGKKGRPSEPFARQAKKKLKALLSGSRKLKLAFDVVKKDKYKRTLAYIYLPDGTDIQAEMIKSGLAKSIVILPNEKNLYCYRRLEDTARNKALGIWQLKQYKLSQAANLSRKKSNYRFITGKVSSIIKKSQYMIIKLDRNLSIKLSAKAFAAYRSKRLLGARVQVRGKVYSYRKKPGMSIFHPANIILTSTLDKKYP